jgi:RNA recognition motif-containing protein
LRKKAVAEDIRETFSAFGSVSTAAVAPNERGYGILRFKNNESVDRAMKKFQRQEVVVQDVAVQLKVVKPGAVEDDSTNGA